MRFQNVTLAFPLLNSWFLVEECIWNKAIRSRIGSWSSLSAPTLHSWFRLASAALICKYPPHRLIPPPSQNNQLHFDWHWERPMSRERTRGQRVIPTRVCREMPRGKILCVYSTCCSPCSLPWQQRSTSEYRAFLSQKIVLKRNMLVMGNPPPYKQLPRSLTETNSYSLMRKPRENRNDRSTCEKKFVESRRSK